jgi:deoxyadenosine/deoxycytidine kinase
MLGFQLFYLVRCLRGYEIARQPHQSIFLERSFEENRMFGYRFLTDPSLSLYRSICSIFETSFVVVPDLVIYLEANMRTIERNFRRRNSPSIDTARIRKYPAIMARDYLHYKRSYVETHRHVVIDMNKVDLDGNATAARDVVDLIGQKLGEIA